MTFMLNLTEYITINPQVCHGKPCFKGTRIMVYQILELLEAGVTPEQIAGKDYFPQLTPRHIEAALHYAGQIMRTHEYVPQGAL